ncbi:hypothetical protein BKP45_02080 [Anaerobacillus alkalidiazotrophicus]|uniref:Sigma-X negative effector n=1 Tax=Anaerobacillus alkalidiazotrophicus TaxID=472963 RepID=A0A1S2MA19_9BACI|nr:GerMN domain-containing protein [Anaerobacillus alkalidiazotrophicus]OIJ21551.1 hypothetical protein BKP45_02080 [Anaerobacillus alkalidiazotrophicus]
MKRSSKWDEKTIENQLKKLPKIEDRQTKEALFEKIQEKIQEKIHENEMIQRKKKSWFIPTIATASVVFLLMLLIPPFFNEQELTTDFPEIHDEAEIMMEMNGRADEETGIDTTEKTFEIDLANELDELGYVGAVTPYDEDRFNDQLVTIAVVTHLPSGEMIVPITLMVNEKSFSERFLAAKETFWGERWGIGSFPPIPINTVTIENDGIVNIDIPEKSLESLSSLESEMYRLVLKETFSQHRFSEIHFTSDGKPGVNWGPYGPLYEIKLQQPNRGYYVFHSNTDHKFLVPGNHEHQGHKSLPEILEMMKQNDLEIGLSAPIREDVAIEEIEEDGDIVIITFSEGAIIEDTIDNLMMLEAIMFTVRDFGHSYVQFKGINIDRIGPYQVKELVPIPNYINFIQ